MARSLNGTTQYLAAASSPISAFPFSMACAFKSSSAADSVLMGLFDHSSATYTGFYLGQNGSNHTIGGISGVSSSFVGGNSVGTWTPGAWTYAGVRFINSTTRKVYCNGVGTDISGAASDPTGSINSLSIGAAYLSAVANYAAGDAAYGVVWNIGLTDADFAMHALGVHPSRIRRQYIVDLFPLDGYNSPENSLFSTRQLTLVNAPLRAAGPPIQMRRGRNKSYSTPVTAVPGNPQSAYALPLNASVLVSALPPLDTGNQAITGYKADDGLGGHTTAAGALPRTVTGLTNGVAVTPRVWAVNASGDGTKASTQAVTPAASMNPFTVAFTFPMNTTIGAGLAYRILDTTGGVCTDLTGWTTTGLVETPSMAPSATQPPGYTINSTISSNNSDGSFSGVIQIRNHSSGVVYDYEPLNTRPTGAVGATRRITAVSRFLATDTFSVPVSRTYRNILGTDKELELPQASEAVNIPITGVTNAWMRDCTFAPDLNGKLDGFVLWVGGPEAYFAHKTLFISP